VGIEFPRTLLDGCHRLSLLNLGEETKRGRILRDSGFQKVIGTAFVRVKLYVSRRTTDMCVRVYVNCADSSMDDLL